MYRITTLFTSLATLVLCTDCSAATFDFEDLPLGTEYSAAAGNAPGDVVLSNWDVDVSVEEFTEGAFVEFNFSQIAGHPGPPTSFFPIGSNPTQTLTTNNMNIKFDFTGVPFDVTGVTLDYVDLGGTENFDINSLGRQEVGALSALAPIAGFNVSVTENPAPGGVQGTLKVEALPGNRIETLLIGGQEFGIDNVVKIPEPSSMTLAMIAGLAMVARCNRRRQLI